MSALAESIVRRIEEDAVRELVTSDRVHLLTAMADQGYELTKAAEGWLELRVAGELVIRCRLDPDLEDLAGRQN